MKLKDEELIEIAKLVDKGYSPIYIACQFNYSRGNMENIVKRYRIHGLNGILHGKSRQYTIDEKLTVINRYYAGESKTSLAIEMNVRFSVIHQWILKYEKLGYNGLIDNRGRPGKTKMGRPRKNSKIEQATSTNEANPAASVTAISANTLRFKSTLANFNPCMNWLYESPFNLAAALIRAIHN